MRIGPPRAPKDTNFTGNSQSSLISELLDGSAPVFDRLIRVLTAAEGAKASLRGHLAMDMAEAQAKVEKQLGLALEDFDGAAQPVLNDFEVVQRRGRKGAGRGALATARTLPDSKPTPISNRGVRSDPTHTKNIAKTLRPSRGKA